jgi:ElaB/YqjD/DUF883 family membrane-anchored ribosome-binding protein
MNANPNPEKPLKTTAARTTREDLINEFDSVISETEQLLKSAAGAGQEQAAVLRTKIEQRLADATQRLARLRDDASDQAAAVAQATDRYVKDDAWRALGIGAAAGAIAGLVLGAWMARR